MRTASTSQTLLVVFNRIGDLTLSTPLLRAVARNSGLSLLTRPFGASLLGGQPYVHHAYSLRHPNRGKSMLGDLLLGGHRRSLGRHLGEVGFDRVLIYETERNVIQRWLGGLFPGRVRKMPRAAPPGTHASALYRLAAASLGCSMEHYDPYPVLEIAPDAQARARRLLGQIGDRVIGVQMGSHRSQHRRLPGSRADLKTLSPSQWGSLMTRLVAERHADALVIHGAPTEGAMVKNLLQRLPAEVRSRCHDFTMRVGLDLLPAVLAEHLALISVDTGPVHIAAAVGCPVLVFFGPTDPAVFGPRGKGLIEVMLGEASCQFCHGTALYKTCRDNRCLNRLEDERLWEAWQRLRGRIESASVPYR